MNVNDLADRLEQFYSGTHIDKAVEMLRQQQAEIEGLKNPILKAISMAFNPLTDEEIRKVADEVFKDYKNWHYYQIDFARAILRKAQEK